jgi:hypothetical protein
MEEVLEYIEYDINNIISKNTNKLQVLYIDLFNAKHEYYKQSINEQINHIRNNDEILQLCIEAFHAGNLHDYKMVIDRNYRMKHSNKYDCNCPDCMSYNIIDLDGQTTCTNCGLVLEYKHAAIGYIERQNYNKYRSSMYKRKTYVKIIINQKLYDLTCNQKEQIVSETNQILAQFNKTKINQRKSFFSYSYMFRYVLNKLKLNEYIDRFKQLKIESINKANAEFYSTF